MALNQRWTAETIPSELAAIHDAPGGTSLRGLADILNRYDELCDGWACTLAEEALAAEAGPEWARIVREDRERLVREDPELAAQIREGIAEAERGETTHLGSFAQYLDDGDDDD